MDTPPRAPVRSALIALALYGLTAIVSLYPQFVRPWDSVGYVGDSVESVYILAWHVHQVLHAPWRQFDANMLYPQAHALTLTDHQLLSSLSGAPVVWTTRNPVLAYNVVVLLALLLCAMAARRLALLLGCHPIGAWAAGALYGFHTYQVNEVPRLQTIVHGFGLLAVGELVVYLQTGRRRAAALTAAFMLLQALCSNYHLLYACVLLGLVTLAFLAARPRPTLARLPFLALCAAVAGVLYLPVGLPYVLSSGELGYARELPIGIDLQHYVSTAAGNVWYGAMGARVKLQMLGPHFVGFVALTLAVVAVVDALRRREDGPLLPVRTWVLGAAALTLLLVALSLGRDVRVFGHLLGPGPYRLLYWTVPGFKLMRLPERLGLLAMAYVGLLVARALTLVHRRFGTVAAVVLAAVVPLEHLAPIAHIDRVPVWGDVPAVYRWLARDDAHAVAEVPIHGEGLVRAESLDMYFSTYHWKPIVAGYASYPTPLSRLLRRLAAQFPSDGTLQAFRRIGVDTVVVHRGRQEGWDLYHQLQGAGRVASFGTLLHAAGLDTEAQLPEAVASGRIRLLSRFEGPGAHVFDARVDEVYRIAPGDTGQPAPWPAGTRLRGDRWRYVAGRGIGAERTGDGRLDTSFVIDDALRGDESVEVIFDAPATVGGLVLPLNWDSVLPTRLAVDTLGADGRWAPVARFTRAHALQMLERLLKDPRHAGVGFAWTPRTASGVRLSVEAGGTSFDGWRMPEIEVMGP